MTNKNFDYCLGRVGDIETEGLVDPRRFQVLKLTVQHVVTMEKVTLPGV